MLETGTFSGTDFAGDMSSKSRTVPENRGRMVTLPLPRLNPKMVWSVDSVPWLQKHLRPFSSIFHQLLEKQGSHGCMQCKYEKPVKTRQKVRK